MQSLGEYKCEINEYIEEILQELITESIYPIDEAAHNKIVGKELRSLLISERGRMLSHKKTSGALKDFTQ